MGDDECIAGDGACALNAVQVKKNAIRFKHEAQYGDQLPTKEEVKNAVEERKANSTGLMQVEHPTKEEVKNAVKERKANSTGLMQVEHPTKEEMKNAVEERKANSTGLMQVEHP